MDRGRRVRLRDRVLGVVDKAEYAHGKSVQSRRAERLCRHDVGQSLVEDDRRRAAAPRVEVVKEIGLGIDDAHARRRLYAAGDAARQQEQRDVRSAVPDALDHGLVSEHIERIGVLPYHQLDRLGDVDDLGTSETENAVAVQLLELFDRGIAVGGHSGHARTEADDADVVLLHRPLDLAEIPQPLRILVHDDERTRDVFLLQFKAEIGERIAAAEQFCRRQKRKQLR